jgi:hypothetical protein
VTISVERRNGGYLIAAIIQGYRVATCYVGFTPSEALAKFLKWIDSSTYRFLLGPDGARFNNVPSAAPKGFGVGSKEQKELEVF